MAERRMFTQKIVDSDAFLDMPLSSQALYFHLNMRADDDGFINSPRKIQRTIGCSEDDLRLLIGKRFIIAFETGVVVIKHWRMHNLLRRDRYNPTQYQEELNQLLLKDNGSYTTNTKIIEAMATDWQPNGNQMAPQVRLGKDSIGKVSIEESENTTQKTKPFKDYYESNDAEVKESIPYKEVIDYLNLMTGKSYKVVESNNKHIRARFNEGHTLDDFKSVIDNKCNEWLEDEKMTKYLRPETLFGTKFDSYRNEGKKDVRKTKDTGVVYS